MALSQVTYTYSGQTSFPVNFTLGYLDQSHVKARINDETDSSGNPKYRDILFISDGVITISGTLNTGDKIVISRFTPRDILYNDYTDGSIITEKNLDTSNKQNIMLAHEALDGRLDGLSQNLDANNFKITNLGKGTNGLDAVNVNQLSELLATINTFTGSTPPNDIVDVTYFGARPNDPTFDNRAAIQLAEDTLYGVFLTRGIQSMLWFPDGDYGISGSLYKKTNVRWGGTGQIRRLDNNSPTGNAFSLVVASNATNWRISGITLINCPHDDIQDGNITTSTATGGHNSCIDIEDCRDFLISDTNFKKYSKAIRVGGDCFDFLISNNSFKADNSKTLSEFLNGTYTSFTKANRVNTGAIEISGTRPLSPQIRENNSNYVIANNNITNYGLDVGIQALAQVYDQNRGFVIGNKISGGHAGVQIYRGSLTELDTNAPTYAGNIFTALNNIDFTWEQGYYQRGVIGCAVANNQFYRTGMGGANGDTSASAITLRVNPFDSAVSSTFLSASASTVSNDHPTLISSNKIVDHGAASSASDANILIEHDHVLCTGNTITRSAEFSTSKQGYAIYGGNGKVYNDLNINNNYIIGSFTVGIAVENTLRNINNQDLIQINNNDLKGNFNTGINVDWYGMGISINDNSLSGTFSNEFISVRNAPYSSIKSNKMHGNTNHVITLKQGNLSSDLPYLMSSGSITNNNRRGGTIKCTDNSFIGSYTGNIFNAEQTTSNDAQFWGRCREFKDNFVNGAKYTLEFSSGIVPTTFNAKTWDKHDFVANSTLGEGNAYGKVCVKSGGYGSTVTTTGNVTSGSNVITNVANLDGYGIGLYIQPSSGFSDPVLITDISVASNTITVSTNSSATATGVTLNVPTPIFWGTSKLGGTTDSESVTISSGVVTITSALDIVRLIVDTEGAASLDEVTSITGGFSGQLLIIRQANASRDVDFLDGVGNLRLQGDYKGQGTTTSRLVLEFDGVNWLEISRSFNNLLQYPSYGAASRVISSGSIDVENFSAELVVVTIDTEGSAATDDLDTISNAKTGQRLILRAADSARDVVVKDGTGNLQLSGDFTLDHVNDTIQLVYTGSTWLELSRSNNSV